MSLNKTFSKLEEYYSLPYLVCWARMSICICLLKVSDNNSKQLSLCRYSKTESEKYEFVEKMRLSLQYSHVFKGLNYQKLMLRLFAKTESIHSMKRSILSFFARAMALKYRSLNAHHFIFKLLSNVIIYLNSLLG